MEKTNKIAYLEGIRGTAAMLVALHHFLLAFYSPASNSTGSPVNEHLGSFELAYTGSPLSVITNGNFMVTLFFVLSGFVLSRSYFRNNQIEILVSSAFRRFIRLYIPVAFTLIIAFIALRSSFWFGTQAAEINHSRWLFAVSQRDTSFKTFISALLYKTMFFGDNTYVNTIWSMAIEFYGSMLVFSVLALTHNTKAKWVILVIVSIIAWFLFNVYYIAFTIGISLNYLEQIPFEKIRYRRIMAYAFVITGLITGGFPSRILNYDKDTVYSISSPPELITNSVSIQQGFYKFAPDVLYNNPETVHIFGAALLITGILLSASFQKFFSRKFFIFLGDISFSAYLLHPLVICIFSCPVFLALYHILNNYNLSVIITFLVTFLVLMLVSKIMTMAVDKPGVRFSKYLYSRFFKSKITDYSVS